MARKQLFFALLVVGVLVSASASQSRLLALDGEATFTGSGTSWQEALKNTGTVVYKCMRTFAPAGVSFTSVSGPSGTKMEGPGAFSNGSLNTKANASETFQIQTSAPLTMSNAPRVKISGDCVGDVDAKVMVTPTAPPPPPPPPAAPPSTTPGCRESEQMLAKKGKQKLAKKRGSSAKSPPSALQGQCTLPPRGPCLNKQGLLIDGGPADETLVGSPLSDTMNGQGGIDTVNGKDDNDLLRGGPGRDMLDGALCDDVLFLSGNDHDAAWQGGPGNDVLNGSAVTMDGGPNDDYVVNGFPRRGTTSGGAGDDLISVTVGEEAIINGGGGKDTIDARNRSKDKIDCGPGSDTLYADQVDTFKNCEKVILK